MVRPLKKAKQRKGKWNSGVSVRLAAVLRSILLFALPYLLVAGLIGVLFGAVVAYAVNSPTFELQEVKILNIGSMNQAQSFEFCELKPGENLITLDLVNVQQMIKRKHPEFKEVRVRRVLPNRVEVVLKRRTPIAQVAFSRFVQIDKDLVVLPGSATAAFRNLTVIDGAVGPRQGLFVGVKLTDRATVKAVKLMDVVKRSGVLRKSTLTKIDIADPKNFSLYVDNDIEIKIGESHFIERLKILGQTLRTVELDRNKIRYIDLRFDDVVIGPK